MKETKMNSLNSNFTLKPNLGKVTLIYFILSKNEVYIIVYIRIVNICNYVHITAYILYNYIYYIYKNR